MEKLLSRFSPAVTTAALLSVLSGGTLAADSASSMISHGYQEWAAGHPDKAQELFERAVKTEPNSVEAHMKLAGLLLSSNNFGASVKEYQRVIGLDPNNAKAFIGLAISYMHSGDKSLTRAALNEALRIEPSRKQQLAPLLAQLDAENP
jgi:Tfp pilus assembly protein PilF